jgi:predicted nucleic acid-binding protein
VDFLLDTNVVSELRRTRPHGAVTAWFSATDPDDIRVPAIALGELQAGAEITRRQNPAKAAELDRWIEEINGSWQVIAIDAAIAREWGRLMERKSKALFEDAMIAATARIHGLIVVTRNVEDFKKFGVRILNPFLNDPEVSGADQIG